MLTTSICATGQKTSVLETLQVVQRPGPHRYHVGKQCPRSDGVAGGQALERKDLRDLARDLVLLQQAHQVAIDLLTPTLCTKRGAQAVVADTYALMGEPWTISVSTQRRL